MTSRPIVELIRSNKILRQIMKTKSTIFTTYSLTLIYDFQHSFAGQSCGNVSRNPQRNEDGVVVVNDVN